MPCSSEVIQPFVRRRLAAGTERNEKTIGDVALRQAELIRLGAVNMNLHLRVVHNLMNVNVHRARDGRHLPHKILSDLVVCRGIAPAHLQIHGRRQAEVENLIGDVGGFEINRAIGEFPLQAFAQYLAVPLSRSMIRFKRNQNIAIAVPNHGIIAKR